METPEKEYHILQWFSPQSDNKHEVTDVYERHFAKVSESWGGIVLLGRQKSSCTPLRGVGNQKIETTSK